MRRAYIIGDDPDRAALAHALMDLHWCVQHGDWSLALTGKGARRSLPLFGDARFTGQALHGYHHKPEDYPECVSEFLGRTVTRSTLEAALCAAQERDIFVKSVTPKAIPGEVWNLRRNDDPRWYECQYEPDMPVWTCAPVRLHNEWRVLAVRGKIVAWSPNPARCRDWNAPDMNVAATIARRLWTGCPMFPATSFDVALTRDDRTVLVEVNGALSLGRYGMDPHAYAKASVIAWQAAFDAPVTT